MNLQSTLAKLFFGKPAAGERVKKDYELHHSTTIPHGGVRPTEQEWSKEFKVGSQYSRFNPQGIWYGDESPAEYNNILKAVLTGSIK